ISRFSDEQSDAAWRSGEGSRGKRHVNGLRTIGRDPLSVVGNDVGCCWVDLPFLIGGCSSSSAVIRGGHRYVAQPQTGNVKVSPVGNIDLIVTASGRFALHYRGIAMVLCAIGFAEIHKICTFVGGFPQISAARNALDGRDINVPEQIYRDF